MTGGPPTRLVIFDFDGVLADSEIIALDELSKCLGDFGVRLTPEDVLDRFLGASIGAIETYVEDRVGALPNGAFRANWYERLFARYERELRLMPGVPDLLAGLQRRKVAFCIASGGSRLRLDFAVRLLELDRWFPDTAFSADSVRAGKPAPDLFLFAARMMGVPPAECLAVEDAPAGVLAARRAGIRAIGFVGGSHLRTCRDRHSAVLAETGAEAVVDTLSEVCRFLVREEGEGDGGAGA